MTTALGGEASNGSTTGAVDGGGAEGTSGSSGSTAGAGSGSTGGSSSSGSWRDSLPEDIRANPSISAFQDVPSLTKAFIHAQSLVGKKGAIVPGEKATEEEWQSFYKAIGVPDSEKYDVPAPKDYKMPDEMSKAFKEVALKNGLLPKQAAGLLDWYAKLETTQVSSKQAAEAESAKQGLAKLKESWGEAYDRELAGAKLAVKELGGDELVKYLNQTGLGNNPTLIQTFAKAAKLMGEDKLREGGVGSDEASTRAEIMDQMNEIRAQGMQNGYYDSKHPAHAMIVQKMESLGKRLTGGR